jgi:membrane-associated protein
MTDTLLALVPTYGVWLVLLALPLSCLALPVPSSILVMAAGSFASAGDLVLWQVQAAAFAGFVLGDQVTYGVARAAGPRLLAALQRRSRLGALCDRAQVMLDKRGAVAVFLSRTIFSPLGPYMGYLSGALRLNWGAFTLAAVLGAACWSMAYSLLGYVFATQITQVAALIGNAVGIILAGAVVVGIGVYLWRSWQAEKARATV